MLALARVLGAAPREWRSGDILIAGSGFRDQAGVANTLMRHSGSAVKWIQEKSGGVGGLFAHDRCCVTLTGELARHVVTMSQAPGPEAPAPGGSIEDQAQNSTLNPSWIFRGLLIVPNIWLNVPLVTKPSAPPNEGVFQALRKSPRNWTRTDSVTGKYFARLRSVFLV